MTLREAQRNFHALPALALGGPMVITRRGKPVLVVLTPSFFDALEETLELLSDRTFNSRLVQSIEAAQEGRTIDPATVRRKLGL